MNAQVVVMVKKKNNMYRQFMDIASFLHYPLSFVCVISFLQFSLLSFFRLLLSLFSMYNGVYVCVCCWVLLCVFVCCCVLLCVFVCFCVFLCVFVCYVCVCMLLCVCVQEVECILFVQVLLSITI